MPPSALDLLRQPSEPRPGGGALAVATVLVGQEIFRPNAAMGADLVVRDLPGLEHLHEKGP